MIRGELVSEGVVVGGKRNEDSKLLSGEYGVVMRACEGCPVGSV